MANEMNYKAEAIIDFWFNKTSGIEKFQRSDEMDNKIRANFLEDLEQAISNAYDSWKDEARSCLALIVLLDQFSRNLFRDNAKAFEQDDKARYLTRYSIENGHISGYSEEEKLFALMPLIHSEDIADHNFAMDMCDKYLKGSANIENIKKSWGDHTKAIKKFGRYPHRNKVLGRDSTKEEIEFLNQPDSSW